MSYSFNVRAATKNEAIEQASTKFAEVLAQQPAHAADMDAARTTVATFLDLLPNDDTQDVTLSVAGYVSGSWSDGGTAMTSLSIVNISVTAALAARA